jgi:hypothetical protein
MNDQEMLDHLNQNNIAAIAARHDAVNRLRLYSEYIMLRADTLPAANTTRIAAIKDSDVGGRHGSHNSYSQRVSTG